MKMKPNYNILNIIDYVMKWELINIFNPRYH